MTRKVVIFTGAPLVDALDWTSPGLLQRFTGPIARFVEDNTLREEGRSRAPAPTTSSASVSATPSILLDCPEWRHLPLKRKHIHTGFSQQHGPYLAEGFQRYHDPGFITTADGSFDGGDPDSQAEWVSEFCQHTLTALDVMPSSQLDSIPVDGNDEDDETQDTTAMDSFMTTTSDGDTTASLGEGDSFVARESAAHHGSARLSNLRDMPNASYLARIEPQTMTVNLVVGIISIAAPRTVKTRWGATRELIELVVGDESRSGFGITFWLSGSASRSGPSRGAAAAAGGEVPEQVLARLRPQDVIHLRNVALGSFQGRVYGLSLPRGITKIHLLYRRKLDADDEGGYYRAADLVSSKATHPQVLKARRVREWVMNFVADVAPVPRVVGKRKRAEGPDAISLGRRRRWDLPPPVNDTQDFIQARK